MPESDFGSKERLNVLLEEYKTLRQESLNTITSRVSIMGYSFATLAVIGSVTVTAKVPDIVAAVTLGFVVPYLARSVTHVWLGEYSRSQRAGDFIADLERRINLLIKPEILSWESHIRTENKKLDLTYKDAIRLFLMLGVFAEGFSIYYMNDAVSHLWFIKEVTHHRFWVFMILAIHVLTMAYVEEVSRISIRKEYATALNYTLARSQQIPNFKKEEKPAQRHVRDDFRESFAEIHGGLVKRVLKAEAFAWRILLSLYNLTRRFRPQEARTVPADSARAPSPLKPSDITDDGFLT